MMNQTHQDSSERRRLDGNNQTKPFSTKGPFLVAPGEGEKIWIVGDTMWFKATSAETAGAFTVIENIALPGNGPPPHIHENEDESMYVIDGEFEILLGTKTVLAKTGAFAFIPRGTVHRFRCVGGRPGKLLILFTPGGIEGFFREAGTPATNDGSAPPVDQAEIARTDLAGRRYGLRVIQWG